MAAHVPPKPSLTPAILALLIIILFGYLIFSDLKSTRTEHTINPPIEIIDQQETLPLTVIKEKSGPTSQDQRIQQEAKQFVQNLSPAPSQPVTIKEHEDQFVRTDSLIHIPELQQRTTTPQALLNDKTLSDSQALTLDFTTQQDTPTTLAQLIKTIDDQTMPITIVTQDGQHITAPLVDIIQQGKIALDAPIILKTRHTHHLKTTLKKLKTLNIAPEQPVRATLEKGKQTLKLSALIPQAKDKSGSLFYLHRVTAQDKQGLWGIIQSGLIDKFRQGLPIKGIHQNKEIVKAVIPADADEKLPSGMSSFLGKILQNKVKTSYIYNFYTKKMGRDPNLIHPGQQLILIEFSPEELIEIYRYFSDKRHQDVNTYAVPD